MMEQVLDFSSNLTLEVLFLLVILVAMEAVLSADNAIALASLSRGLEDPQQQQKALNIGLIIAFVLRIALILTATIVIRYWQFQLAGAVYLLWLVWRYYSSNDGEDGESRSMKFQSLWHVIPMIAFTDLAFSLDSVTAAIAVSNQTWLVVTGATLGIIALRFMANLFIRWLQEYVHLEDAGYITVGLVGIRLLLRVFEYDWLFPEWMLITCIFVLFAWGFSQRTEVVLEADNLNTQVINEQVKVADIAADKREVETEVKVD